MHVCSEVSKPKIKLKIIVEQNGKSFKGVSKTKKKT